MSKSMGKRLADQMEFLVVEAPGVHGPVAMHPAMELLRIEHGLCGRCLLAPDCTILDVLSGAIDNYDIRFAMTQCPNFQEK